MERRQGGLKMKDVEKKKEQFMKATLNRFEKEFMPRGNNGFSKIMDEN